MILLKMSVSYDIDYDLEFLNVDIEVNGSMITSNHLYNKDELLEFAKMITNDDHRACSVYSDGGSSGYSELKYNNKQVIIEHDTGHCNCSMTFPSEYFKELAKNILEDEILNK